jgi:hypothetical protein
MKLTRNFVALALSFSLCLVTFLSFPSYRTQAQDQKTALQRGYRTGYSDGYMAGYRDVADGAMRAPDSHREYSTADRAYSKDYGTVEDYRNGYQQGFQVGYDTGFEKKSFDATLPVDLAFKTITLATNTGSDTSSAIKNDSTSNSKIDVAVDSKDSAISTTSTTDTAGNSGDTARITTTDEKTGPRSDTVEIRTSNSDSNGAVVVIPVDTELIVELLDDLNTEKNTAGDKFRGRVVSPAELDGAMIEGKISKIQKPGRIKRRAELLLSFDTINLSDNRWSNYNGILTEVLPIKGDNVSRVDNEGTVQGQSSVKKDAVKVGTSTGGGLVLGAVVGGPVGAGVGAAMGAAFGVGTVVVSHGKNVKLVKGQQLRVRTAYETRIR